MRVSKVNLVGAAAAGAVGFAIIVGGGEITRKLGLGMNGIFLNGVLAAAAAYAITKVIRTRWIVLVDCRSCGQKISDQLYRCPSCGAAQ